MIYLNRIFRQREVQVYEITKYSFTCANIVLYTIAEIEPYKKKVYI